MMTADSSVWISYFNGRDTPQTRLLDAALDDSSQDLVLLDVVLMEVLRGFQRDADCQTARQAFAPLPRFTAGGEAVALRAARIYRELRAEGATVRSAVDLLVGAWCIENDCPLLHADRDFKQLPELAAWPA